MGKESKKSGYIYMCITYSFCCTAKSNTTLSINHTIKNKIINIKPLNEMLKLPGLFTFLTIDDTTFTN